MDGSYAHRFIPKSPGLMTFADSIIKQNNIARLTCGALTISGFELAPSGHKN
jgi:hypothetical protein